MRLIAPLFDGPVDIIGDVHGEIEALSGLMDELGYDAAGGHREGRRAVFAGDLVDRGPDSPAVLEHVIELVEAGRAQCVIGNHELNLLRGVEKHGNNWYTNPAAPSPYPAKPAKNEAQKQRFAAFVAKLPVALEREDLRVVHACWQRDAVEQLRAHGAPGESVLEVYRHHAMRIRERRDDPALKAQYVQEQSRYGDKLTDPGWQPPVFLSATAEMDVMEQMGNPVRVLTSGEEQPGEQPFWAAGKWRMVRRVAWWDGYTEATPVVVGHYWRRYAEAHRYIAEEYGPDLFAGVEPHHWMGARRNVYCVDLSVGGRSWARRSEVPPYVFKLAALRVPEWQVVHDDGERWEIGPPGG